MKQYAMDYADNFPQEGQDANGRSGYDRLRTQAYLTDYGVYNCPSTVTTKGSGDKPLLPFHYSVNVDDEAIYDYSIAHGMMEGSSDRFGNADSALATDRVDGRDQNSGAPNHSDYGNILFLDGHVKGYPTDKWLQNSGINQLLDPAQAGSEG